MPDQRDGLILRHQLHTLRHRRQRDAAIAAVARSPAFRCWVEKATEYAVETAVEAAAVAEFLELTREEES